MAIERWWPSWGLARGPFRDLGRMEREMEITATLRCFGSSPSQDQGSERQSRN
jgi:hypothetical protein